MTSLSLSKRPQRLEGSLALLLVLLGLSCFARDLLGLWFSWTHDALRSIGMFFPFVSAVLAWRALRGHDWHSGGQWWGLLPMLFAMVLGLLENSQTLFFTLYDVTRPSLILCHFHAFYIGVKLWLYFSGALLFFGGTQAWRRAAFAVLLLLFVNPVPALLNSIDLPLQALGARSAHGFARLIGVPVDSQALTLMFSGQLGIFIAPGCDGMRGAVTMGYLALLVGHFRAMPKFWLALYVVAAMLMAYVLNLLRLCGVIAYYWCALRFPGLGHYGTEADYVIGGVLFFLAAMLLFSVAKGVKRCGRN